MNIFDPHITGSLSVSASAHIEGDLTVLGTIRGDAQITGEVDSAISASHAASYLLTSSFEGVSGSFAITGSNNFKGDQTISGSLLPEGTLVHDIGSESQRWNDIYLAGSTIDIGGTKISKNDDGDVQFHDSGNTLKKIIASEIQIGHGNNRKTLKVSNGRFKLTGLEDIEEGLSNLSGSFTGSFVGDGSQLINVPASGVTGLSLDSISSGSNSLFMGATVLESNVSILPNITDTIDLGSPTKQWRDLFLSSGSLYINGQQVLSTTGDELRITTDTGESIKIIETSTDTITLQTEDGDITLTASGNGNIELDAPIQIGAGNKILSSDGNEIHFGNGLSVTGSVVLTGTVDGVDIAGLNTTFNSFTTSNDTTNNNQDLRLGSIETKTGSLDTHKTTVEGGLEFTGSNVTIKGNLLVKGTETRVNSTTIDLNDNIISLNGTGASDAGIEVRDVTSPGILSGSLLWDGTSNYWKGGSKGNEERLLDSSDLTTLDGDITTLRTDLNTYTSSNDGRLDSIETTTGSLKSQVSSLEGFTASIDDTYATDSDVTTLRTDLNTYTSSNDGNITTIGSRLDSVETKTGSLSSDINTLDGRVDTIESQTGSYQDGYDYSQVGHLPLSGGTITGNVTLENLRTSNSGKLYLWNDHNANYLDYRLWVASSSAGMTIKNTSAGGGIILQTNSTTALTIDSSQNATFVGTLSASGYNDGNWNTAYGWGDHSTEGYLTSYNNEFVSGVTFNSTNGVLTFTRNNGGDTFTVDIDGRYSLLNHVHTFASLTSKPTTLSGYGITDAATSTQGSNADTAYGWGDHSTEGYIKSFTNTNEFVTGATFNNGNGIITFRRNNGGDTFTVDIDGRFLDTRAQVHSELYSSGGDANDYTEFGIYRNYGSNGPIVGHNTILHVSQTDGNYGFQLGGSTVVNGDGLYFRNFAGTDTITGSTWYHIATRDWVGDQNYVTTTGYNNTNWDTAYGWGDHSTEGYLTSYNNEFVTGATFNSINGVVTFTRNDGDTFTVDLDGRYLTAYSESDTLDSVSDRGNSTDQTLSMGGIVINGAAGTATSIKFNENGTDLIGIRYSGNASGNPLDIHNFQTDTLLMRVLESGVTTFNNSLTASSFIKSGGTSSQFLKADGSVDSSTYLTAHPTVSASASSNNGGRTYIQDILLDGFGHITGITTATETVVDTNNFVTGHSWNSSTGVLTTTLNDGSTTNVNLVNTLSDVTVTGGTYASGTQILTLTKNDGSTVDVSGFAIDTDVNWYTTGSTFNSSNGIITFTRSDGGTYTVDIDGKYSLLNHVHTFASLTSKPTTLSGYGITDGATSTQGSNADTAYGWGDHATEGYLTSYNNEYTTGATFNTGDGVITFRRNDGDTFTVDIDGRFASSSHKYHSFSNGDEYYDGYGQNNFLRLFTENSVHDNFRFRSYSDVEYYNGSQWVSWNQNLDTLFDGLETTGFNLSHTHSKFRFVIQRSSGWPTTANFVIQSSWSDINTTTGSVTLETHDGSQYNLKDSWTYGSYQRGYNLHTTTQAHDGKTQMRVTIDLNWSDASHDYTALRRILMLSNFSGNQYDMKPFTWAYDQSVTFANVINVSGGNSTEWNTSYDYSQVGHLPLSGGTITGSLEVRQTEDNNGIKIFGYDDRSTYSGNIYIDSGGNFKINQTHGVGSGYIQIGAENYLSLDAASLVYTSSTFRIYDAGRLDFGSSGDYKIKYNASADNLVIHTNDNLGITLDSVGNTTFTGTVSASGYNDGNWNTAYGWGNHASAGYISSFTDTNEFVTGATFNTGNGIITFTRNNGGDTFTVDIDGRHVFKSGDTMTGTLIVPTLQIGNATFSRSGDQNHVHFVGTALIPNTSTTSSNSNMGTSTYRWKGVYGGLGDFSGIVTASGGNSGNWNTAYGWGNHASAGYLTSFTETDTLESVTDRGATTTNGITVGELTTTKISTSTDSNLYLYPTGNGHLYLGDSGNGMNMYHYSQQNNGKYTTFTHNGTYYRISPTATSGLEITSNTRITGTLTASGYNDANWNTAYGWGDHSGVYLPIGGKAADSELLDGIDSTDVLHGNANGTNDSVTTDLDGLDKTGFYTSSAFVTKPSGVSNWMYVNHIKLYNSNTNYQKQIGYDTYDDRMWLRTKDNGTWTSWKSVWNSGDFANNSSNWDTAHGWGNHASAGYLTSSSTQSKYLRSDTDDTTSGALTIGDGGNQARLIIKKADNDISDHIAFYNGTTRIGEIGAQDDTWLRINQNTSKNIYTPRYIRADAGFFVDGTSKGINSSGNFFGGTITGASDANVSNWDTAYGWGNHASAGYLTSYSETDTLSDVINRGNTTTGSISFTGTGANTGIKFNSTVVANDGFGIRVNGTSNAGELEFYSTDDDTEPFVFRHYTSGQDGTGSSVEWFRIGAGGNISTPGTVTASGGNSGNWNTSYGWGNHASAGYLTSSDNEFVTGATFNGSNGIVTFTRNNGGDTFTLNLASTLTDVTVTGGTYTSGTQTLRLTKSDGNTIDVSGFAIDTDVNWYTTGATFNTGNGIITGTHQGGTWTVDIDGRFLPLDGGTLSGDINMGSGKGITFYGNGNRHHGIFGHDSSGNAGDDIRINSYHNVHINLDSNNNNTTETTFFTIGEHGGTGSLGTVFSVDGTGNVNTSGTVTASGGNSGNWNTAYGWGNHASAGYITSPNGGNADTLDSLDSTQFLRSDVSDTHTATLTVNGQFIFNSSTNSSYREGIRLNVSTGGWGGGVFGGVRDSISGVTDGWWVARNPSKDFVISYGTSANSGGLYLPHNSSALEYKNNRIWNESDFANNSGNWNTAYGWGDHASAGYLTSAVTTETNSFLGDGGSASTHPGTGRVIFSGQVSAGSGALGMPTVDNSNAFLNINRHSGEYNSQLGFSSNGHIYYRKFSSAAINGTQPWLQVYHSGVFTNNSSNWNTAYGWGDHASGGYLSDDTNYLKSNTHDTFTGKLSVGSTSSRSAGMYGTYDSYKIGHIWSMGTGYSIPDDGSNFGNLYGIAYKHTNNTTGGSMAGGHQAVFTNNGTAGAAISFSGGIWTSGTLSASGYNDSNWNTAYGWGNHASAGYLTSQDDDLPIGGGTLTGGLTIAGSVDSGATDMGYYQSVGTNIILKGDSIGRSGIFFESEKDGTNINDPSDYGFIQFHSYGYGNTSGEANNFVIGVSNDSTDKVILQAPYNGGVMIGYKDATSGTGLTLSEVIHSNSSSYNNGNWDTAYGWGDHASAGYTSNTGTLTDSNDRNYITDSRGAARAPSYYDDRYAQWDFQNVSDTGVGGDGWHALLTVSKWASFDASHRQEQLIFSGDHLWRRTATSDSAWGTNKKIWDSGNLTNNSGNWDTAYGWGDHAGAGYLTSLPSHNHDGRYLLIGGKAADSDKLDGIDSGTFMRRDSNVSLASGSKFSFHSGGGGTTFGNNHYSMGVDIANTGWSSPNYSDLIIGYHTGIRIGAAYGGTRFYNNSPTTDTDNTGNGNGNEGLIMTVGGAAGTNSIIVQGTITASGGNSGNWNTAYGWGNHASGGYATLSGSNSFTNSYNEFGNGTGSVSNDGSWNARVNIAGTQHARLDVKSVSDGIITTMYSHTGNNRGKIGTMSNHSLDLMVNGTTRATLNSSGLLDVSGPIDAVKINLTGEVNINNSTSNKINFNDSSAYWLSTANNWGLYWDTSNNSLGFHGSGTEKGSIDLDNGNLQMDGTGRFGSYIATNTEQTRSKIRLWDTDTNYAIGFKSGYDFGHLGNSSGTGNEYAISFMLNDNNARGFWWGKDTHSDDRGAMALTTDGRLNVAKSVSIGEGESVVNPSSTPLYVEGTTAGSTVFDVQGTQGQLFSITDDLTGDLFSVSDISGIPILTVNSLGVVTIDDTLRVTGDVIAYSSSDSRLKDNVTPISNPLDKLKMIGGYEFDWNGLSKNNGHDVGVIAQEIESVLPELVETRGDGFKGVQYDKLTALLIEAVKEQQIQIDELKSKLNK